MVRQLSVLTGAATFHPFCLLITKMVTSEVVDQPSQPSNNSKKCSSALTIVLSKSSNEVFDRDDMLDERMVKPKRSL